MKVLRQWIVYSDNTFQLIVYCPQGHYFITETGAFQQVPMRWRRISNLEAELLIEDKNDIPK